MHVFPPTKKEELLKLLKLGFHQEQPKTPYEALRLKSQKKDVTAVLYTNGRLLVQGKAGDVEMFKEDVLPKIIPQSTRPAQKTLFEVGQRKESRETIIGSDETLKGDTFGGIVVAAVKADEEMHKKLLALGVADSKKLADRQIPALAEKIRKMAACEIKMLYPEEYNEAMRKHKTITSLLNKLHNECYASLKPGKHVVDLFPGCTAGDVRVTHAEDKYPEVAAASIIARAAALEQREALSRRAGFQLPLGSTHVAGALQELKKRGLHFEQFVKMEFGNVRGMLEK